MDIVSPVHGSLAADDRERQHEKGRADNIHTEAHGEGKLEVRLLIPIQTEGVWRTLRGYPRGLGAPCVCVVPFYTSLGRIYSYHDGPRGYGILQPAGLPRSITLDQR